MVKLFNRIYCMLNLLNAINPYRFFLTNKWLKFQRYWDNLELPKQTHLCEMISSITLLVLIALFTHLLHFYYIFYKLFFLILCILISFLEWVVLHHLLYTAHLFLLVTKSLMFKWNSLFRWWNLKRSIPMMGLKMILCLNELNCCFHWMVDFI